MPGMAQGLPGFQTQVAARSVFFTLVLLLLVTYIFSSLDSLDRLDSGAGDLKEMNILFPSNSHRPQLSIMILVKE